jgi:hypothetical protein
MAETKTKPTKVNVRNFIAGVVSRLAVGLFAVLVLTTVASADSLDGWWKSDGYGTLLEIGGNEIKGSEITAISCLPSFSAKRLDTMAEDAEAIFAITPEQIIVRPGRSADHKFFMLKGAASSMGFRRINQPPPICKELPTNTPLDTFDIFWVTFDEHYPFFALHGINWRDVRDKYRPQITNETTEEELFNIFKAMIEPLHDAHTYVMGAQQKLFFGGMRENTARIDDKASQRISEIIETKTVHGRLQKFCNGRVSYGVLSNSIGYLRLTAFAGYADPSDFDHQAKALDDALDTIFADVDNLQGLIIDVRINRGGSDVLGVAVTSRLATSEYLAFAKKARIDPSDPGRFTDSQVTHVPVSIRPHFHGKVVLLTGSNTVSAGETFAMALMGRTPGVIRVGENTQGVFSDVLGRKLPNGFQFGVPNEIFLTEDGKAFDGPGIPPHVRVPVFSKDDIENGRDSALEKAIEVLQGK